MNCTNCDGSGLADKTQDGVVFAQEVCSVCQGMGKVGNAPTEETIVQKVKRVLKKK